VALRNIPIVKRPLRGVIGGVARGRRCLAGHSKWDGGLVTSRFRVCTDLIELQLINRHKRSGLKVWERQHGTFKSLHPSVLILYSRNNTSPSTRSTMRIRKPATFSPWHRLAHSCSPPPVQAASTFTTPHKPTSPSYKHSTRRIRSAYTT
jgi:hypothetical protein